MISNCLECGWALRKRSESTPNTRIGYTNGTCGACYQRGLRASKHMPIPRQVPTNSDLTWQEDAACANTDPDMFMPDVGGSTRAAKAICAVCPVRERCLNWALENNEHQGIYGGLAPLERRALERKRKRAAA